jgi:formylmethanofuran dehydrogenase subunit E
MDAHTNAHCRYYNLTPEFSIGDLASFHGHLGPYIVLGYRIGKFIRTHFCNDPFRMKAEIHCSGVPPQSCLADGIQLGSGCTLGKRNIEIVSSENIRCVFVSDERQIVVTPRPFMLPKRDGEYEAAIEAVAERMYSLPDAELFDVSAP